MIQNLLDRTKAVIRAKLIVIQANLRNQKQKQNKTQINNLNLHQKELDKEQTKPKVSRGKTIIKIRAEINERD